MKKYLFLIVAITTTFSVLKAQHHCKCKLNKIERKLEGNNGAHNEVIDSSRQHPLTTFRKFGDNTWFNPKADQATNLDSLRERLRKAYDSDIERKRYRLLYQSIWSQAQGTIKPFCHIAKEGGGVGTNAKIAKAAAFCLIANYDKNGDTLTQAIRDTLKSKVVYAIMRYEYRDDDDYFDDLIASPWNWRKLDSLKKKYDFDNDGIKENHEITKDHFGSHFWFNKALIMLLEAYDLTVAVYPNDSELKDCSKILMCLSRNVYHTSTSAPWAAGLRAGDNHGLTAAGAIGLASVVLADQTVKKFNTSWEPITWAYYAHWRTISALWDFPDGQFETIPGD